MSRKLIIAVLVLALAGMGIYFFRHRGVAAAAPEQAAQPGPAAPTPPPVPPQHPSPAPALSADEALSRAEDLSKSGKAQEARSFYERALEADPNGPKGKRAAKALADYYEALKQPRKALGYLLRSDLTPAEREAALAQAHDMAETLFGSELEKKSAFVVASPLASAPKPSLSRLLLNLSGHSPDDIQVTVGAGDTLGKIAARNGVTVECLKRLNAIRDENRIMEGQRIKVIRGTFSIQVEKAAFRLTLLLDGVPVRTYSVGIGAEGKTPAGSFVIEEKLKDPAWTPLGRPPLPYGHPDNILGTRWMGFKNTAEYSGLGIHGTTKDETIGQAASNGCVRMHNADVEELFDLVPRGTVVEVKD